ncbi:MAG: orotidine-5'-phosphate decarboxylase [Actinobacteria bacterium]|nr:orotidine-5'-phosphate decarboxylase [Actinomycetota bacterium]
MTAAPSAARPTADTARDRLVLPLDVGDLAAAEAMMAMVGEWFGVAKVGMELYAEAGPAAFARFKDLGYRVFADLKLHDIPNTVRRAARAHGRHGVDFLNFHTAGGLDMMRAAVDGLREGAADAGLAPPVALGVTVLTSDPDASAFPARLQVAVDAGCDGVVCSALELRAARGAGMTAMVPGIRPAGAAADDQARVATPTTAIADGATWLVIGRPVTAAADPAAAAAAIHTEVATALGG